MPVHKHDREARLDHRDGSMLEIRHRPRPRQHVASFGQLERDLFRRTEVESAAEDDGPRAEKGGYKTVKLVVLLEGRRKRGRHLAERGLE